MSGADSQFDATVRRHDAPSASPSSTRRDASFPLIALLQLAAFSASLAACIDGRELRETLTHSPVGFIAVAVVVSVILGFGTVAFGFAHLRSWRTAFAAGAIGALHGPAILAVFVAPAPFWRAGPAIGVLLLTTILLRVRSA